MPRARLTLACRLQLGIHHFLQLHHLRQRSAAQWVRASELQAAYYLRGGGAGT